jgi:hypothetical protein
MAASDRQILDISSIHLPDKEIELSTIPNRLSICYIGTISYQHLLIGILVGITG